MSRRILITEVLLILAAFAMSFLSYPHLPAQIVTHWGAHLQPDGWSPRITVFGLGPGLMAGLTILTLLGPWLSPRRFETFGFNSIYQSVMFTTFCLFTWLFGVLLWNALGHPMNIGRFMITGVCLAVIFIGNMFGKYRKNAFAGIRTPWTLASDRVWYATHRVAAWSTTLCGFVGFVLAAFGMGKWAITLIIIGFAVPIVYSFVLYKSLVRRGEISAS